MTEARFAKKKQMEQASVSVMSAHEDIKLKEQYSDAAARSSGKKATI